MRFGWMLGLVACQEPAPGAETDDRTGTPLDTDGVDTDVPPEATGCYDVPLRATGGFGGNADPFVAAGPGAVAQMEFGPQGGWHVETQVRVEAVHPGIAFNVTITRVSSGQVLSGSEGVDDANYGTVFLVLDGECSGYVTARRAFLDDVIPGDTLEVLEPDICPLGSAEVDVRWDVTDLTDGRTGTATVRAVLALDPDDVAACSAL